MKQTYEKVMQIELVTLGLAIILGFVALFQGSIYFMILSFYLLAASLVCDAYSHQYTTHREWQGGKQVVRAALLFFLATAVFFLL